MSDLKTLSMADALELQRQANAAVQALKTARAAEVASFMEAIVEDIILTQREPRVEKSGWTHFAEQTTVTLHDVEYRVNVEVTDVALTKTRKAAVKAAEAQEPANA